MVLLYFSEVLNNKYKQCWMFVRRKGYLAWDGPFQSTNLWWAQISSSSDWPGTNGQVIKIIYPWESLHCMVNWQLKKTEPLVYSWCVLHDARNPGCLASPQGSVQKVQWLLWCKSLSSLPKNLLTILLTCYPCMNSSQISDAWTASRNNLNS